jgi:hypothetical protein
MNLNVFEIARKGMVEVKQETTCKLLNSQFKKKSEIKYEYLKVWCFEFVQLELDYNNEH